MPHYLMSVHGPVERTEFGNYGSKEAMEEAFAATGAFNDKLKAEGYWVFAGGLQPATTATVVDGQGDAPVVTDGPYLETKESIGGFWVIDAPDLDVALQAGCRGIQGLPRPGRGPSLRGPCLNACSAARPPWSGSSARSTAG